MEAPLELIVELAVTEVIHVILRSKCCQWSHRKWKKVMKHVELSKEERNERIQEALATLTDEAKQNILDYANKITKISEV